MTKVLNISLALLALAHSASAAQVVGNVDYISAFSSKTPGVTLTFAATTPAHSHTLDTGVTAGSIFSTSVGVTETDYT